jgi:DNA-binding MarR family transcriptional regulator
MSADADGIAREILETIPAVMSTIRTEMRSRRRSDLSVMQFRTLAYLSLYPGSSLSSLAEYLGLTLPTVSQMINGLVEKGVVTRQNSSTDRRRVMLSLTSGGHSLLEKSVRGTQARLVEILSPLQTQDIEAVHQALQLLNQLFCPT